MTTNYLKDKKMRVLDVEMILELNETYYPEFKMPQKSIDMAKSSYLDDFAKETIVYHRGDYNKNIIYRTVCQREPTNIGNQQFYDKQLLKKYSKKWSRRTKIKEYTQSYYKTYYEKFQMLAPNIAVYCYTPVFFRNQTKNIHLINLIALAFDDKSQMDYRCYKKIEDITHRNYYFFIHMQECWNYAFHCAQSKGIKNLYFFGIGEGAFSLLLDDLQIDRNYFKTAFESVYKKYHINVLNYPVDECNRIPNVIFSDFSEKELKNVLFVNAWDPHSICGNGNTSDNSLDGYFGRSSCCGILSWPLCNKYATFIEI
jgi:hypothetical protein